jgi:hypothetical protein
MAKEKSWFIQWCLFRRRSFTWSRDAQDYAVTVGREFVYSLGTHDELETEN